MKRTLTPAFAISPFFPGPFFPGPFFSALIFSAVVLSAATSSAHEGDHGAPGLVEAPKGGEIKAIENTYIEVLPQGRDVKIYLYTKDLKPITTVTGYTLSAEAQLPKLKAKEPLVLKEQGGVFTTTFDAKAAHRYTLLLRIKDHTQKHDDVLKFTIESRK